MAKKPYLKYSKKARVITRAVRRDREVEVDKLKF